MERVAYLESQLEAIPELLGKVQPPDAELPRLIRSIYDDRIRARIHDEIQRRIDIMAIANHAYNRIGHPALDDPNMHQELEDRLNLLSSHPWRVALAMQAAGWTLRSDIIWKRKTSIPEPTAKDRPWRTYEHIFMFTKSVRYYFDREALTGEEDVWSIEPERNSLARGTHYAPYPRELVRRCLSAGCPDGGTVLDPFVGGGTTMSVALEMNRDAIGIELNPGFCEHIVRVLGTNQLDLR